MVGARLLDCDSPGEWTKMITHFLASKRTKTLLKKVLALRLYLSWSDKAMEALEIDADDEFINENWSHGCWLPNEFQILFICKTDESVKR